MITVGLVPIYKSSTHKLAQLTSRDKRVMLTPQNVAKFKDDFLEINITKNAGILSGFADQEYKESGAKIVSLAKIYSSQILLFQTAPTSNEISKFKKGQIIIGYLNSRNSNIAAQLTKKNCWGIDIELIPRMISAAQNMDVLSSQTSLAGYCAVLKAADQAKFILPMISSAAGTIKPANILILGTGIAGLQAIATAKRLGAQVTGYDIRPTSKNEVESLGAKFLDLSIKGLDKEDNGGKLNNDGYAQELSPKQIADQQKLLNNDLGKYDIVITTAKVPGKIPPKLITSNGVLNLKKGAVAIDMAASSAGGNIDGSQDGKTLITPNRAYIIGASNLESDAAKSASTLLGNNISYILKHFIKDGQFMPDFDNQVDQALVITKYTKKDNTKYS
ncbi:MAG: NAD(P) transhydrogenase subunit alpha [Bifidobacteriaceae bacterium]|jgi:NAD(P) transhydrogenase subunit alpha|nr:NAD(P) transhydrogenase subunit alpha [Bifidobacteriaceae bacterium]